MIEPVLQVRNLQVTYPMKGARFGRGRDFAAVRDVSFTINAGQTLGLVGESGSGKSSTGMGLLRLIPGCSGSVLYKGEEVLTARQGDLRRIRRQMQVVFQDPYGSLNPRMKVRRILTEPFRAQSIDKSQEECHEDTIDALANVGLAASDADKYPSEFSGGQLQRIAIARALMLQPGFLVCDEAVSALDVSTQGQILGLLSRIQDETGIAMLFIAHDLAVVRSVADYVGVMYAGELVEIGPADAVVTNPAHPYTALLISSVPRIELDDSIRILQSPALSAEAADPVNPPSGCRFHPRCPFAMEICRTETPSNRPTPVGGMVACHLHDIGPQLKGRSVHEADQKV